jgi:phenylpropionate dioxygenase-like ring-hydroxylating dioxygenase large terminal subunit
VNTYGFINFRHIVSKHKIVSQFPTKIYTYTSDNHNNNNHNHNNNNNNNADDKINDNKNNSTNLELQKTQYCMGVFPRLEYPNEHGQLTWYPIGFSMGFGLKPKRVTIRDKNYIVWKDSENYYGVRDACSHQGSSFLLGKVCKNTISCPYHGYIFDGSNGDLIEIPKLPHIESSNHNIDCFKVVERGGMIYLNTIPLTDSTMKDKIDETKIFIEPEYFKPNQRAVRLSEDFEHNAKFVSVNSLDICHIGFVHTFGNRNSPNPLHNSKVVKMDDCDNHYKITYEYVAGENSLVNKVYNYNNITVENEYILPHSTVARVKFGDFTSTIITHALPISKFQSKLFVKAYRSYWTHDIKNNKNMYLLLPFLNLVNLIGDKITYNTMYNTLKQDKAIVDCIDKTTYETMHGKFSIVHDKFSNHYKNNYKKYYEDDFGLI